MKKNIISLLVVLILSFSLTSVFARMVTEVQTEPIVEKKTGVVNENVESDEEMTDIDDTGSNTNSTVKRIDTGHVHEMWVTAEYVLRDKNNPDKILSKVTVKKTFEGNLQEKLDGYMEFNVAEFNVTNSEMASMHGITEENLNSTKYIAGVETKVYLKAKIKDPAEYEEENSNDPNIFEKAKAAGVAPIDGELRPDDNLVFEFSLSSQKGRNNLNNLLGSQTLMTSLIGGGGKPVETEAKIQDGDRMFTLPDVPVEEEDPEGGGGDEGGDEGDDPITGDITFVPNTSYSVSGNRRGWVNSSIPVAVLLDADPTELENEEKQSRDYRYGDYENHHTKVNKVYGEKYDEEKDKMVTDYSDLKSFDWKSGYDYSTHSKSVDVYQYWKVKIDVTGSGVNDLVNPGGTVVIPGQNNAGIYLSGDGEWKTISNNWVDVPSLPSAPGDDKVYWVPGSPSQGKKPNDTYSGSSSVYKIDIIDPNISISTTNVNNRWWTKGSINASFNFTDNLSGLWNGSHVKVAGVSSASVSGGGSDSGVSFYNSNLSVPTPASNKYDTESYVEDYATNTGNISYEYWMDNTDPNISFSEPFATDWGGYVNDITREFDVSTSDSHSGLNSFNVTGERKYLDDNINPQTEIMPSSNSSSNYGTSGNNESNSHSDSSHVLVNREGRIRFTASTTDYVGLTESKITDYMYVDVSKPIIESVEYLDADGNVVSELVSDSVAKIRITAFDKYSGIKEGEYWFTYENNGEVVAIVDANNEWKHSLTGYSTAPNYDIEDPERVTVTVDLNSNEKAHINFKKGIINLGLRVEDNVGNVRLINDPSALGDQPPKDKEDDPEGGGGSGGSGGSGGDDEDITTPTSGNPGTGEVRDYGPYRIKTNKLENLKIVEVLDPRWKWYFGDEDKNIAVDNMAAYTINNKNQFDPIALGYRVDLELDTIGFEGPNDTIDVNTRYFAETKFGEVEEVDIYVKNGSGYYRIDTVSDYDQYREYTLTQSDRSEHRFLDELPDRDKPLAATYKMESMLPYEIRILPEGTGTTQFDLYGADEQVFKSKEYNSILVALEIVGNKEIDGNMKTVNYVLEEDEWMENTDNAINDSTKRIINTKYGKGKGIKNGVFNLGLPNGENDVYKGQIYWYDLNTTAYDIEYEGTIHS